MTDFNTTSSPAQAQGARRFGAFGGVFTPSILTILGVVMYLLLPWVVGNVGLGGALLVIGLSHVVSFATGLSVSSIATNRTVGAGGAYFMISRSLGAPAGAAVGIPLFFAQALSLSFYVVGFTESIVYLLPEPGDNPVIQIIFSSHFLAITTATVLILVALRSAELAIKTQYFVMAAIGLSLVSIFLGGTERSFNDIEWFVSSDSARASGSRGFSEVFAVFFPAVTGIMAGVSMSGDLKDARSALPKGTLVAILSGFVIYLILPVFLALNFDLATLAADEDPTRVGIQNQSVFRVALWPSLVYAGLWGATLSSAVGCILAAPRTIQALAYDGLAPAFLAKGSGPANEPRAGLLLTFVLAIGGILLGSLDLIAQILTIFFLATYGVTNLACGLEKWAASPSFRPTFKVSAGVSLLGAAACFYVMSIIDLGAMLAAACLCFVIYVWVQRRSLNTTFGDARHGLWSALVRTSLYHLHRSEYHDLNWRPNLLIFGGPPAQRAYLLHMGASVVQERGITSYIEMLKGNVSELISDRDKVQRNFSALAPRYPNVFFRADIVPDVYRGVVTIAQSYGIGNFQSNTVMLGWPNKRERSASYFRMVEDLILLDNTLMLVKYDDAKGFGKHRHIHVWWGGLQANGGMMLLLAYLTISHHLWRQAKVTALTVVDSEDARDKAKTGLENIFKSARLDAEAKVILRESESIEAIISRESKNVDLAFLGLRLPHDAEDPADLFDHYEGLLKNLPTTVLVHSGNDFKAAPILFDV